MTDTPHPPVTTRLARAADLPEVLVMIHALAAHHEDASTLDLDTLSRDVLGDRPWLTLLVAENSGRLVGYAALCPLMQLQFGVRGMDMHHLFVAPDARRAGVGSALIRASIEEAKAQSCRYLTVGTMPGNAEAQATYRAAGFEDIPPPGPRFRMKF